MSETAELAKAELDGKTFQGTRQHLAEDQTQRHRMNLAKAETGVVLKEHVVAGKEREWTPGKAFLTLLLLQGRIISAGALYTQKSFCQQLVASRGDYLLFANSFPETSPLDILYIHVVCIFRGERHAKDKGRGGEYAGAIARSRAGELSPQGVCGDDAGRYRAPGGDYARRDPVAFWQQGGALQHAHSRVLSGGGGKVSRHLPGRGHAPAKTSPYSY